MPFGEYELSPSLIGLSLLHTPHPEAFQRLLVRPSIPCYRDFSLDMCRSLGFASAPTNWTASSASLSLRLGVSSLLTSLVMATRRFIMQKARRHRKNRLRPLVFSLAGWARQIRAGLLVSRVTQDTTRPCLCSCTGLSPSLTELSRTFHSTFKYHGVVLQPLRCIATTQVWAPPRSLATTGGIIVILFSWRY